MIHEWFILGSIMCLCDWVTHFFVAESICRSLQVTEEWHPAAYSFHTQTVILLIAHFVSFTGLNNNKIILKMIYWYGLTKSVVDSQQIYFNTDIRWWFRYTFWLKKLLHLKRNRRLWFIVSVSLKTEVKSFVT